MSESLQNVPDNDNVMPAAISARIVDEYERPGAIYAA
jgi:hypothetical protein